MNTRNNTHTHALRHSYFLSSLCVCLSLSLCLTLSLSHSFSSLWSLMHKSHIVENWNGLSLNRLDRKTLWGTSQSIKFARETETGIDRKMLNGVWGEGGECIKYGNKKNMEGWLLVNISTKPQFSGQQTLVLVQHSLTPLKKTFFASRKLCKHSSAIFAVLQCCSAAMLYSWV